MAQRIYFICQSHARFLKTKLWVEARIRKALKGYKGEVLFAEHHYSHAASAYFCSDFSEAVVVTMDGVGEFDTTTFGYGKGNQLKLSHTIEFPPLPRFILFRHYLLSWF